LESSLVSLGYVESTVTHMSDDLKYGSGCANGDVLVWDPAVQPAGAWKCETPVDADTLGGISCPVDGDTVQFVAGTWVCDSRTNTIYQDLYDPMHGLLSPFTGLPGSIPYWDGVRWQKAFTDLFNDGMGRIGIGTSTPVTTLDVRSTSGDGDIAVGGSAKSAADAGAGAIRYSSGSGGVLEYSNGTAWNTLTSTVSKSLVSGTFDASTYANAYFGELAATEVTDVNGDFALGRFTAPRTGNYTFTATVSTTSTNDMVANGTWELQFDPDIGDKYVSRFVSPAAATGYTATVTGAYTVNLTAGEQVRFMVYNSTGSSKTIAGPDYNRFSIVEN
ncbi:MAG: hypothetical protein RLZZ299_2408, partial [Pseudomonadota bacterium]